MEQKNVMKTLDLDCVRSILQDGTPYKVAEGLEVVVPREIAVALLCAMEAYNAFAVQYNKATRNGTLEGTAAMAALEAERFRKVNDLHDASLHFYKFCGDTLAEYLAEVGVMTLEATDDLSEEELAERAAQTEKEQAAASALEGYVAAQAERYQAALQDAVLDGVLSVEEYDNVAETPYKQLRREMYDGAVLEAKKELGEDVAGGKLSHADYFAITGEEYTVAAGEKGTEAAT